MNEHEWREARDDRTIRYAGRVLDANQWILLRADHEYATRYDGQVALLTAANLFGRMSPAVALDVPNVPIVPQLPWAGQDLHGFLEAQLQRIDPFAGFCFRQYRVGDYVIHLGSRSNHSVVHGSGWNAYIGPSPSPLTETSNTNPIGPAFAAIMAAAEVFVHDFPSLNKPCALNAFTWKLGAPGLDLPEIEQQPDIGDAWVVGTGSVGTAILYFLTFATRRLKVALFDHDRVEIHNLDRSPIFTNDQIEWHKVRATEAYLREAGVTEITTEHSPLHDAREWSRRQQGIPDLLISAANEFKVRYTIETGYPPIQLYGTTGQHWQAAIIRHIPMRGACSCCVFPDETLTPTRCATAEVTIPNEEKRVDAALPFLSFAAGAMAAAEILKLALPGFPFSPNLVLLNTNPMLRIVTVEKPILPGCVCRTRNTGVHHQMIAGTRFADLSA